MALSQSVSFSLGRCYIINPCRSAMSEKASGWYQINQKQRSLQPEKIWNAAKRANRFLRSQTLYNECALMTENELVGKKLRWENVLNFWLVKIIYKGALTAGVEHPLPTAVSSALASVWLSAVQFHILTFISNISLKHPIRKWNSWSSKHCRYRE